MKEFIANHAVSWVIEIAILSIIAFVTINETRKTAEQTREMLTTVSQFVANQREPIESAIKSVTDEAKNIEIDGRINLNTVDMDDVKDIASSFFNKDKEE